MSQFQGTALFLLVCAAQVLVAQAGPNTSLASGLAQGEKALAEGRYSDAELIYRSLKKLNPGIAEVHARLGLTLFQEKQFEAAVPFLRQAFRLKPALPNTDVLLAMCFSELGQYSEALPGLEKGFRHSADRVLKRMAGLQLERTYTGLQRDRNAVETAIEMAKTYPDDPEVLYHASRLFGNFAYVTLLKLATVAPDSPWRHQAAGEVYESQEQHNLAISEISEGSGP